MSSESDTMSTENDNQAEAEELSLDPQTTDEDDYRWDESGRTFQFRELKRYIETANKAFLDIQPTASRTEHNERQRDHFSAMRAMIAGNASIPDALFQPPRTFIRVCIVATPIEGHYCCPCDLDESDAVDFVEIRAPSGTTDGITKTVFVEQLAHAIYGIDSTVGEEADRPIIESFDYMVSSDCGGAIMGDIWALTRGFEEKSVLRSGSHRTENQ